jgi:hypothetical protein
MSELIKRVGMQDVAEIGSERTEWKEPAISLRRFGGFELPECNQRAGLLIVFLGILVLQTILYGPSLIGQKILLPLDILAQPGVYLPKADGVTNIEPHNASLSDLVYQMEPWRRFAISELRAGRLPMWAPYEFGGVPFIYPKFSPFLFLQCCISSPVVLAWSQLLEALVAGFGAYFFMRRALGLRYWPAALCAVGYPITAYFILWQGFPLTMPVCWLPWLLLAVDRTVRGTSPLAPIWLGLTTCLVLISGHVDVAGQVLLGSGLYALWCLMERPWRQWMTSSAGKSVLLLVLGWGLGFALSSPYLLPLVEYTRTGVRMERRAAGFEARPPIGLSALPQVVLPDMYGTMENESVRSAPDHQAESSASAYAGLIATLLAAPLAFCNKARRRRNVFWVLLLVFSLSWCLNVPVMTELLRLPGLNMLSHNRMVFLAGFAVLMLAAEGLETLSTELATWRWWMWLPTGLMAALCLWCGFRAFISPAPIQETLTRAVQHGQTHWANDPQSVKRVYETYARYYSTAAIWCGIGLLGWLALRARPRWQTAFLPFMGGLFVVELLCFGYGKNDQCDPKMYYPEIPAFKKLSTCMPGRIMGYECLPPITSAANGLWDIRGYDAVDPARMVNLLLKTADPKSLKFEYALTEYLKPVTTMTSAGTVRLMPILDMLSVRYLVFRGALLPLAKPIVESPDYWIVENPNALPRVFVPRRAEIVTDDAGRLEKMASQQFDPRNVVYLETPTALPENCKGAAQIVDEIPTRIKIALEMETAGIVVLSDRWDKGWHAYLSGKEVPILRANHAVRGVSVPAGNGELEFRYEPASFAFGLRLAGLSALVISAWLVFVSWRSRSTAGKSSPSAVCTA